MLAVRIGALTAVAALAIGVSGCSLLPVSGDFPPSEPDFEPVGPRFEMGPAPAFDDGVATPQSIVFFETADGWCLEYDHGAGCAGGGGGLPTGFSGFGGSEGSDGTCIDSVSGKDIVELRLQPDGRPPVTLRPLPGSDQAPVNVFMACWGPDVRFERIAAEGVDKDGNTVAPGG